MDSNSSKSINSENNSQQLELPKAPLDSNIDAVKDTSANSKENALVPDYKLSTRDYVDGNSSGDVERKTARTRRSSSESGEIPVPPKKKKDDYGGVSAKDGLSTELTDAKLAELPTYFLEHECYQHFSKPKGLAIIFNNRKFKKPPSKFWKGPSLKERIGTDIDCGKMEALLTKLGYSVRVKQNHTSKEVMEAMDAFSKESKHNRCHSAVVVLSHGYEGHFYGSDNREVEIQKFIGLLNGQHCPALKGKPKLFIFQVCRGKKLDVGTVSPNAALIPRCTTSYSETASSESDSGTTSSESDSERPVEDNSEIERSVTNQSIERLDEACEDTMPTDADISTAYPTTLGYGSWRNSVRGSWFIEAICDVFSREADREEIYHLFVKVNGLVTKRMTTVTKRITVGYKQAPEFCSTFTKKFYFMPGL